MYSSYWQAHPAAVTQRGSEHLNTQKDDSHDRPYRSEHSSRYDGQSESRARGNGHRFAEHPRDHAAETEYLRAEDVRLQQAYRITPPLGRAAEPDYRDTVQRSQEWYPTQSSQRPSSRTSLWDQRREHPFIELIPGHPSVSGPPYHEASIYRSREENKHDHASARTAVGGPISAGSAIQEPVFIRSGTGRGDHLLPPRHDQLDGLHRNDEPSRVLREPNPPPASGRSGHWYGSDHPSYQYDPEVYVEHAGMRFDQSLGGLVREPAMTQWVNPAWHSIPAGYHVAPSYSFQHPSARSTQPDVDSPLLKQSARYLLDMPDYIPPDTRQHVVEAGRRHVAGDSPWRTADQTESYQYGPDPAQWQAERAEVPARSGRQKAGYIPESRALRGEVDGFYDVGQHDSRMTGYIRGDSRTNSFALIRSEMRPLDQYPQSPPPHEGLVLDGRYRNGYHAAQIDDSYTVVGYESGGADRYEFTPVNADSDSRRRSSRKLHQAERDRKEREAAAVISQEAQCHGCQQQTSHDDRYFARTGYCKACYKHVHAEAVRVPPRPTRRRLLGEIDSSRATLPSLLTAPGYALESAKTTETMSATGADVPLDQKSSDSPKPRHQLETASPNPTDSLAMLTPLSRAGPDPDALEVNSEPERKPRRRQIKDKVVVTYDASLGQQAPQVDLATNLKVPGEVDSEATEIMETSSSEVYQKRPTRTRGVLPLQYQPQRHRQAGLPRPMPIKRALLTGAIKKRKRRRRLISPSPELSMGVSEAFRARTMYPESFERVDSPFIRLNEMLGISAEQDFTRSRNGYATLAVDVNDVFNPLCDAAESEFSSRFASPEYKTSSGISSLATLQKYLRTRPFHMPYKRRPRHISQVKYPLSNVRGVMIEHNLIRILLRVSEQHNASFHLKAKSHSRTEKWLELAQASRQARKESISSSQTLEDESAKASELAERTKAARQAAARAGLVKARARRSELARERWDKMQGSTTGGTSEGVRSPVTTLVSASGRPIRAARKIAEAALTEAESAPSSPDQQMMRKGSGGRHALTAKKREEKGRAGLTEVQVKLDDIGEPDRKRLTKRKHRVVKIESEDEVIIKRTRGVSGPAPPSSASPSVAAKARSRKRPGHSNGSTAVNGKDEKISQSVLRTRKGWETRRANQAAREASAIADGPAHERNGSLSASASCPEPRISRKTDFNASPTSLNGQGDHLVADHSRMSSEEAQDVEEDMDDGISSSATRVVVPSAFGGRKRRAREAPDKIRVERL